LTIKGVLVSLIPIVIVVARLQGLELTEGTIMPVIDTIIGVVDRSPVRRPAS